MPCSKCSSPPARGVRLRRRTPTHCAGRSLPTTSQTNAVNTAHIAKRTGPITSVLACDRFWEVHDEARAAHEERGAWNIAGRAASAYHSYCTDLLRCRARAMQLSHWRPCTQRAIATALGNWPLVAKVVCSLRVTSRHISNGKRGPVLNHPLTFRSLECHHSPA
jgi:hypothetical protein